jgi:non-ribosomal peptide synthetase component E (peptide arylation enzyme)
LTKKNLSRVDGERFYRTDGLLRMDNNGFLHYQRRKDYQIQLYEQRIQLGQIEQCLLRAYISLVWPLNGMMIISSIYVQTSHINEK